MELNTSTLIGNERAEMKQRVVKALHRAIRFMKEVKYFGYLLL